MPYRIFQFIDAELPPAIPEDDLSTPGVESTLSDSVGGAFDFYGSTRRAPRKHEIVAKGRYVGGNDVVYLVDHLGNFIVDHLGNFIIVGTMAAMLRGQVDALKILEGERGLLYRRREDDGVVHTKLARLRKVDHTQKIDDAGVVSNVVARFESNQTAWYDGSPTTESIALTVGTNYLAINNSGHIPILDAVITVTPTTALHSLQIIGTGINWTWAGTVLAPNSLVIRCGGTPTIRNNGIDAYSGFTRNSGHTVDTWLPLARGNNTLYAVTDDTGTLSVAYYNQWK